MPNKLQCEQPKENKLEHEERATLDNLIREQVIHALGTPLNLRHVQVRKVSDTQYRVNVIVGENAGAVKVANSYFLVVDSEGGLVSATPSITKQY
jgi:gamma-glutamyltranspeptidase